MDTIILSVIAVGIIGMLLGILIAVAAKKFAVQLDPRIEEVTALLPGANCGGCGFAGCSDLAKNIVEGTAPIGKCPVCSAENNEKIAGILGLTAEKKEKMVAVVLCSGTITNSKAAAGYNGILDCRSANIMNGGGKSCRFGCIGFGSCTRACRFGAIEVIDGLAVVHPDLCTGCGQCAAVCPRKLIKLVPAAVPVHIYCNSIEKPVVRRKKCVGSCLSCRKCIKAEPEKVSSQGFMVRINYTNPPDAEIIGKANCPAKCLMTPEQHLQAVLNNAKKKEGAA